MEFEVAFFGEGKVWDAARGGVLCTFVNGKYVTSDPYEITHLKKNGYEFEEIGAMAEAVEEVVQQMTKGEIMQVLEDRGISFNARMKKADLEALL
jgi:hypothetical protein